MNSRIGERFARALSLRVIVLCLVAGIGGGVLAGMAFGTAATMPAVWVIAALCYLVAVFNDGQMVKCDACGKRVKMGAQRCHHCGYQPAPQQ